jgi:sugar lactone lactonase YvrE/predicted esterase
MRFACLLGAPLLLAAQTYELGPDSQPHEGTPKGIVTRHQLAPGKVYAGVPHNYAVYVSAMYDAAKPTPFMVFLDGSGALGNGQRVPTVFDNLIAKGALPPLIGIFVDPGVLPAPSPDAQDRFHRILEYDSIDGRFARFLEQELIAEVAKKYNLSKDPNDHAIAGVSTGAVGAFVVAWERPDLFRRVLSFIGTFVHMRGADSFPAMIRRTEPKPLRIFLEAGKNDHLVPGQPFGTFYAGSWPINNQLMFEALEFAGYDVKLEYGENQHNMTHGSAIMPDALRWLWRDYPRKIEARQPRAMGEKGWDPRAQVYSVILPGKGWEPVADAAAGLAAAKDGRLFFSDPTANRIYVVSADGKVSVFKEKTGAAGALRVAADGRLYAAAGHRIVSFGESGDERAAAKDVDAADFVLTDKGAIYYIDAAKKSIGLIDPSGKRRGVYDGQGFNKPAALTLSPDQSLLLVADVQSRFNWSFQIQADGSLASGEPFYRVDLAEASTRGSSGATVDSIGQAYFATALGIQLCEQNGRCGAIIAKPVPGDLGRITFGGKDLGWLYAIDGGKLYRREVKVRGVDLSTRMKPPKPPL